MNGYHLGACAPLGQPLKPSSIVSNTGKGTIDEVLHVTQPLLGDTWRRGIRGCDAPQAAPVALHHLLDDPRLAVLALEQPHGLGIVEDVFGLRVDLQLPAAQTATDVGVVHQEQAAVPFFDVGVGPLA